jgi:simple sugar transport system permease protein
VVILLQFLLFKTNFGFKLRAVGLNPVTAETTGINSQKMTILSMSIAGGVAGLGGALLVMGDIRYVIGIESSYGFDGIAVALIGQNIPFGVALAAILFGFLKQSGVNLGENTDIPPEIIVALQSWIIFFIAAPLIARRFYGFLIKKRKEEEN